MVSFIMANLMRWSTADIADAVHAGFERRATDDNLEQAVYGFDALDELGLHPIIQASLSQAGFGVWPEQRYPGDATRTKRSEGKRCDIVLTPQPDMPLRDPLISGTLFDQQPACDRSDAYWLEIKTVAQFETSGPFPRYASELLQPVAKDVKKIWSDPTIRFGGLLIVLFTHDRETAEHDLLAWHTRCLEKSYPVAPPALRGLRLIDRIGNGWCATAMFGVRGV